MEQEDISYYLVADELPTEGVIKKILEICEADLGEGLYNSYERLVDEKQMGTIFKTMAIVPDSTVVPAGFQKTDVLVDFG